MDFQEIKVAVSLEKAAESLGLQLKPSGGAFRCACPKCEGSDRQLVITPGKGWYCFNAKRGGDVIALVAHVKGIGQREAAAALVEQFLSKEQSPRSGNSTRHGARKGKNTAAIRLIHSRQEKPANDDEPEEDAPPTRDPTDYSELL
jgi:CHC2 zinc finger